METFFGLHGAGYIERAGTGTLDMIARCREAGLDAPDFRQDGDMFNRMATARLMQFSIARALYYCMFSRRFRS